MQIHCFASIPLDADEPVPAIRQFVRVLRGCAIGTDRSEVDLNLIGTSARARSTIQQFRPQRTKGEPFAPALDIAEELTNLGTARIQSLHFILSADDFRWKGSIEAGSAKLLLLFGNKRSPRSLRRQNAGGIAGATGIRLELEASLMTILRMSPAAPGLWNDSWPCCRDRADEVVAAKNRHTSTWHCFLVRRP
jgi:hypothetical protein